MTTAVTTGLVQKIKLNYDYGYVGVYIGPTPSNAQLFCVDFRRPDIGSFGNNQREAAFLKLMVEQLFSCMLAQREVAIYHAEDGSTITDVEVGVAGGLMPP